MEEERREMRQGEREIISRVGGRMGKGRCWGGGHLRIHLLLDNSQEDLSPTLESCEVCGSARTPPGNWKRKGGGGGRRVR